MNLDASEILLSVDADHEAFVYREHCIAQFCNIKGLLAGSRLRGRYLKQPVA